MHVNITVDNFLRFDPNQVDERTLTALSEILIVNNPDDPMFVPYTLIRSDMHRNWIIPRGFALKLMQGFNAFGYEVIWHDERAIVNAQIPNVTDKIESRDYQVKALQRLAYAQQGIYEAPPGAGKTITSSLLISAAQQRTIILVDDMGLAKQWEERIKAALNFDVGFIWGGKWDECDITIALRQSLWARMDQLRAQNWFSRWGLVILDECHAVSAPSVQEIFNEFPAYFRVGISATPDRDPWKQIVSRAIIGEIVCRTTDKELEDAGILIRPRIVAVPTEFSFQWKKGNNVHKEWHRMVDALAMDRPRNQRIANIMNAERGHTVLVTVDRKEHAHELAAWALTTSWGSDDVMMMTGDNTAQERNDIRHRASKGNCLIISTIGKQGLDIPRLDRVILAAPTKKDYLIRQIVGRLKRTHDTKTEAPILYDIWDRNVERLHRQFNDRRGAYDRDQLHLTVATS